MNKECEFKGICTDPENEGCLLGFMNYHRTCQHHSKKNDAENQENQENQDLPLTWSGNSFGEIDINVVTYIRKPTIIGLVGPSNAGKTTFLATLYMLLRSGKKIKNFSFAGSYTLLGWEHLAHFLTFKADNQIEFPPHTSRNLGRIPGLLHLSLKNENDEFKDILFTDAPGEWFSTWATNVNADGARGARWIDKHSDRTVLFADCEEFKKNIGGFRLQLKQIAERMRNNNKARPIALVWAKSDVEINKEIKTGIGKNISGLFSNYKEFDVSVKNNANGKLLINIMNTIDWLFESKLNNKKIKIDVKNTSDFFFVLR